MNDEMRLAILRTLPFLIVICVIAILIKRKKIKPQELDLVKPFSVKHYLLWTLGFLTFTLLTEFFLSYFGILEVSKWKHSFSPSVILITGAVILAPIAEELLFRGLVLNALKKKVSIHLSIFIQAIFFVLLHNFTTKTHCHLILVLYNPLLMRRYLVMHVIIRNHFTCQ